MVLQDVVVKEKFFFKLWNGYEPGYISGLMGILSQDEFNRILKEYNKAAEKAMINLIVYTISAIIISIVPSVTIKMQMKGMPPLTKDSLNNIQEMKPIITFACLVGGIALPIAAYKIYRTIQLNRDLTRITKIFNKEFETRQIVFNSSKKEYMVKGKKEISYALSISYNATVGAPINTTIYATPSITSSGATIIHPPTATIVTPMNTSYGHIPPPVYPQPSFPQQPSYPQQPYPQQPYPQQPYPQQPYPQQPSYPTLPRAPSQQVQQVQQQVQQTQEKVQQTSDYVQMEMDTFSTSEE
ncbi:hypothetical protein DLAC_10263 [Tieghemostelium lacteum]|uniref:Uncharacterized protein n=1 Tax=Tieghemostelium lacteum TaxID=361077 RepID=A0A151Z4Y6_TIELA|nr:hypothetical protein DLAC_10263 [Tieghemostelium lacteum]|eukprot:KYQ89039.1 hypothetical protein DLAC_10263 [Tieghemostelium lacteum]